MTIFCLQLALERPKRLGIPKFWSRTAPGDLDKPLKFPSAWARSGKLSNIPFWCNHETSHVKVVETGYRELFKAIKMTYGRYRSDKAFPRYAWLFE